MAASWSITPAFEMATSWSITPALIGPDHEQSEAVGREKWVTGRATSKDEIGNIASIGRHHEQFSPISKLPDEMNFVPLRFAA